jgi:hypothetical protein
VLRALSKRRELRYQTANDVKTEVSAIAAGPVPVGAPGGADVLEAPRPIGDARPQLSPKAAVSFCCAQAASATAFAPMLIAARGLGVGTALVWALFVIAGPMALTGFVFSIWSLIEISRSRGRLYGKRYAVPGLLLPVFVPVVVGFLFMVLRSAPMQQAAPASAPVVSTAAPMPSDPDHPFWALSHADAPLDFSARLALVDPEDIATIRALDPVERERQAREGRLGPAFLPADRWPAPLTEFSRWRIQASGPSSMPVLIGLSNATHTIHFYVVPRVVGTDVRWYFDVAPVDVRSKLPSDDE